MYYDLLNKGDLLPAVTVLMTMKILLTGVFIVGALAKMVKLKPDGLLLSIFRQLGFIVD